MIRNWAAELKATVGKKLAGPELAAVLGAERLVAELKTSARGRAA